MDDDALLFMNLGDWLPPTFDIWAHKSYILPGLVRNIWCLSILHANYEKLNCGLDSL